MAASEALRQRNAAATNERTTSTSFAIDTNEEHYKERATSQGPSNSAATKFRNTAKQICLVTFLWWCLSILSGVLYHDGIRPSIQYDVLVQYDLLFRKAGALVPFVLVGLRALFLLFIDGKAFRGYQDKGVVIVYVVMTVVRAAVYHMLLWAGNQGNRPGDRVFLSDHVFLAAAVMSMCTAEGCLQAALIRSDKTSAIARGLCWGVLVVAGVVVVLTCAEVHVTARHYHDGEDVWMAAVSGFAIFQMPLYYWCIQVLPHASGF